RGPHQHQWLRPCPWILLYPRMTCRATDVEDEVGVDAAEREDHDLICSRGWHARHRGIHAGVTGDGHSRSPLGLPTSIGACLFDLDGVFTDTAAVHLAAWRELFDEFLQQRAATDDLPFVPFTDDDYRRFVDG